MQNKLKLYGFNNLTKALSFNIYDVCYAKTEREQRDYIKYIDQQYNSERLTGILERVTEMIGAHVLHISKQDYDLSSMMGGHGAADDDSPENVDSSDDSAGGKAKGTDKIPVVTAVKDMFASVKSNDMTSFKAWLDAGGDGIDKEVNAIQYGYGVSPVVYLSLIHI